MLTNYKNFILKKRKNLLNNLLVKKITIFLILGITINLFVGGLYFLLLYFGLSTLLSLSISYFLGVLCSVYYNKNLTFNFKNKNISIWIKFIFLHLLCYCLCQTSNQLILYLFQEYKYVLLIGFVISIGLAATTNFVGMNIIVNIENKK
jgi:GtrA-like protein.